MSYIKPIRNIQNKIKNYSKYLNDLEEPLYFSKIHFDFSSNQKNNSFEGEIILTFGIIYIFIKKGKQDVSVTKIWLPNCKKITYSLEKNNKFLTIITQKESSYKITKAKKKKKLYEYLSQIIYVLTAKNTSLKQKPVLNPQLPNKNFPISYLILKRTLYYIIIDISQNKIEPQKIEGIEYFNQEQIYDDGTLIIDSDFKPSIFGPYFSQAISTISCINQIEFKNFNHMSNNFLGLVINNCSNVTELIFCDYKSEQQVFNLSNVQKVCTQKFSFIDSYSKSFMNFMTSIENSACGITNLCLSSLDAKNSDLVSILDKMKEIEAFNVLTNFELSRLKIDEFPFELFTQFLTSKDKLESLKISEIDVNGSDLFKAICECDPPIYELHLNRLNFEDEIKIKMDGTKIYLPFKLLLVDFSHSTFSYKSLGSILQLITSNHLKTNFLRLNMSYLLPNDDSLSKVIQSIDLKNCHSNIIDLNWSGNILNEGFFDFVLSQEGLEFLSLIDLRIENQQDFFDHLFEVIKKMPILIGIEIGCDNFKLQPLIKFICSCKELQKIEHFCFKSQKEQNLIVEELAELFVSLHKLKEVSIEIQEMNIESFIKIGNAIIKNKSIKACNLKDYNSSQTKRQNKSDLNFVLQSINSLKVPSTMEQRALSAILALKENQSLMSVDLGTTIDMNCSNHQIIEENFENENENNEFEIEIEEEEEDTDDN
ncbi:hypothetical protein M9Y10_007626 [Tritrichomonas musculus]|uniref:Uncharacterized protein n=1 Tax=Tritrichomonas musculus TaxID=1915356 RepID=A0ABR2J296_9EUKA